MKSSIIVFFFFLIFKFSFHSQTNKRNQLRFVQKKKEKKRFFAQTIEMIHQNHKLKETKRRRD